MGFLVDRLNCSVVKSQTMIIQQLSHCVDMIGNCMGIFGGAFNIFLQIIEQIESMVVFNVWNYLFVVFNIFMCVLCL